MPVLVNTTLIFLGLIPSFVWLLFYLREDYKHPEPKRLILFTFLVSGLMTLALIPIQLFLSRTIMSAGIDGHSFTAFVFLAFTEELTKFFTVLLFIHKRREFDEPLDAMIYMIVAGLGFAAVENVASVINVANGTVFNIAIFEAITLRAIGATLLHTLASGIVGYYWAHAFIRSKGEFLLVHKSEFHILFAGLGLATVLHAIFNKLIIMSGPASIAILFVVILAFFLLNDFEKLKKEDA
ncbi:MAG: PrsW family glutamic-type intramembrane protease [Patescibacteria group bacterium]